MRILLALASHELQHVGSLRSSYRIQVRDGDRRVDEWRTRGDEARERMVDTFLEEKEFGPEDAIFLHDADQRHPVDILEKLRSHDLDMVCAHYYRRDTKMVQSLCFPVEDGRWPILPYLDPPTEGLHELSTAGFGCVLIKKKVLQAVKALYPDMSPIQIAPLPEITNDHRNFGPDFRFFYLARKLGFKLWLDASLESYHAVTLWLGHKSARRLVEYGQWADEARQIFVKRLELYGVNSYAFKQRLQILEAQKRGYEAEVEPLKGHELTEEQYQEYQKLSMALYEMDGRIKEMKYWIEAWDKYPSIEHPEQLPTTENTPKQETLDGESLKEREAGYKQTAVELAELLPDMPVNGNGTGKVS